MTDNKNASDDFLTSNNNSLETPKIIVDSCRTEFFYEKFKQSYPMFKNPRGLCLIVNIYQIDGMPPRRWSDRDTESLKQLFEQLLFNVKIYTDSTHDLSCKNFKKILTDFSKLPEHEEAQCCIVCLMSHGEEGFLTTKEGDKVLLDDIFTLFNNINCPNLAGKPKLFFIQSCRDDPILGPAEDLGIRLSYSSQTNKEILNNSSTTAIEQEKTDETDGNVIKQNFETDSMNVTSSLSSSSNNPLMFYHIPSLCDMLIGFPTQKGFIAYRKPEIGSWYMNAIVQVFSKHSCDTDLCAMLNMVNSMISNEVTNMGKKQMSEFTSKLTKPYFYFFPGLATESSEEEEETTTTTTISSSTSDTVLDSNYTVDELCDLKTKTKYEDIYNSKRNHLDSNNYLNEFKKFDPNYLLNDQSDNNHVKSSILLTNKHIEYVASKACSYWKPIAREIKINENQIIEIDRNSLKLDEKLLYVLNLWITSKENHFTLDNLLKILTACRLNKIKEEFLMTQF